MIESLFQVDFLQGGETIRLLSTGEILQQEPVVKITQAADVFTPIGSPWGESAAKGDSLTSIGWSVVRQHASHAAARAYCIAHTATMPTGTSGTLKFTIKGGDVCEISDVSFLTSATALRVPCSGFQTITVYSVQGGAMAYTVRDSAIMPDAGQLLWRITEEDVGNGLEKWMEFGFECEDSYGLSGNATSGWTDAGGLVRISLLRSENLLTWTEGELIDCAGSPEVADAGWHTYWSRSIFPIDSAVKIGQLRAENFGDARNNPIIAVTLDGTLQSLPNYPYDMPGDAGQLQADLRSAGWHGATVTATSVEDWVILMPDTHLSSFGQFSSVTWPTWYAPSPMGGLVAVSNAYFLGAYTNSVGTPTFLQHQFCRLKLAAL